MPKQNRVTPYGEIIATSARGTLMGNRGILHDEQQQIVRPYQHKAWIFCLLEFKGRRRAVMSPGKYTELFFLDEATALAAGHRPCFECQREKAESFRNAWRAANSELVGDGRLKAGQIDAVLHAERLTPARRIKDRRKRTYPAPLAELPNGTFVAGDGAPYLVWGERLYPWTAVGYLTPGQRPPDIQVVVLTPRSIVQALAGGYRPMVHPSAGIEP
ncbi:MAG: hypothetical protein H6659_06965 [Ardenticatenaceae bacterium]|nr:hypothetical protein [Ardenticatenaceae bacterium]